MDILISHCIERWNARSLVYNSTLSYVGKLTTLSLSLVLNSGYSPTLLVRWLRPLFEPSQWFPATPSTSPTFNSIWKEDCYIRSSRQNTIVPLHDEEPRGRISPPAGVHPDRHNTRCHQEIWTCCWHRDDTAALSRRLFCKPRKELLFFKSRKLYADLTTECADQMVSKRKEVNVLDDAP